MKNLSEKISELRRLRNMTQEDLAGELHVSRQAVSKWETGRSLPSVDLLREIAQTLDVPISELLMPNDADELAYRNLEELNKVRKWNKFLFIGVIAAVVVAIAGLTLGLVFGLNPQFANQEAEQDLVGLFYDPTDVAMPRDGEIVTLESLLKEEGAFVVYTKVRDENGDESYRYKVRGIKPDITSAGGSYATFHGTLYYDSSKWGKNSIKLYEIFRSEDGVMRLNYPKQGVKNGKAPAYNRDDGSASQNTDSIRSLKIETRGVRPIKGAVLTERDENFDEIKKTDIFEDLSRGGKGLLYTLDPRTCYVVFSISKPKISNPSEIYTETKCVATGDLERVYWFPILDKNGFYVFDNATGYLTFDLPKYSP